jgi:cobalt-zinc-cadmium efflux system outer membrane protein
MRDHELHRTSPVSPGDRRYPASDTGSRARGFCENTLAFVWQSQAPTRRPAVPRPSGPGAGRLPPGAPVNSWGMGRRLAQTRARAVLVLVSILLWAGAGCQRYEARPLDAAAVTEALTPPEAQALQVQAANLRHPILEPLKLDLQDGLSPAEVGVLAVLLNPSLRAARDQRALAEAQLLQARLLPNPELSFNFETPTGGDTEGTVNVFGLELAWDVTSLLSRGANVQGAQAHRAAVEMDVAWQEWQVAQNARTAVVKLVSLERQIALQEEVQALLQENVELTRKAVASGTRTAKDLSAAQAQARTAYTDLLDLRRQAVQQHFQLNRLLGLPPEPPVRLSPAVELPSSFQPPEVQTLLADLEQRRLDLVALRRGYDSQEATVRAAILNQFPRLSLGPTVGRDTDNVHTVGVGVAVDLPIFQHNQGRIAVEQATRRKLFDEYVNRVFETQSEVYVLLSRIRFLNEEIAAAREAEQDLQKLVEDYRTALAAGRVDILTYYAAWNDATSNRMRLIGLQEQLAQAIIDLESVTGLYDIPPTGSVSTSPSAPQENSPR